jgi:AcrR family transcriptional regulator
MRSPSVPRARSAVRRLAKPRRRRGTPIETRERLVAAAAAELNRSGFHGTDSNRIARAAGYAPGTFYKHFTDKREILLAAYEAWVTAEWQVVERLAAERLPPAEIARRVVDAVLVFHRRWQGLRAALRVLVAQDAQARAFHRKQRRRQLDALRALRRGAPSAASRAADAHLLYTLERACDAIADGEARALGVDEHALVARLVADVRAAIPPR